MKITHSLDPVWDEILYVPVHDTKSKFVLEVMDYQQSSKDRTLGSADIAIDSLLKAGTDAVDAPWLSTGRSSEQSVSLVSEGKRVVKGKVYYEAEFVPCANINVSFAPVESPVDKAETASITEIDGAASPDAKDRVVGLPASPKVNGTAPTEPIGRSSVATRKSFESARTDLTAEIGGVDGKAAKPSRRDMTSEEALRSQAGILVMNVISGEIANPKRRGRLEIYVNSECASLRHVFSSRGLTLAAQTGPRVRYM